MFSHNKGKNSEDSGLHTVFSGGPEGASEVPDPAAVGAGRDVEEAGAGLSLVDQITQLQGEKQELMNMMVRRQADFENYRKRNEKERQQERHRGVEMLIDQLLPVMDAFDRALSGQKDAAAADYLKGFEMIRRQLWDTLVKQGVSRIDSVGKEFNPHLHHAIEQVPTSEHDEGTVIGEMQPGYMFQDRVLRPAMVRVATHSESKTASAARKDN